MGGSQHIGQHGQAGRMIDDQELDLIDAFRLIDLVGHQQAVLAVLGSQVFQWTPIGSLQCPAHGTGIGLGIEAVPLPIEGIDERAEGVGCSVLLLPLCKVKAETRRGDFYLHVAAVLAAHLVERAGNLAQGAVFGHFHQRLEYVLVVDGRLLELF